MATEDLSKSHAEQEIDLVVDAFRTDLGKMAVLIAKRNNDDSLTRKHVTRAAMNLIDFRNLDRNWSDVFLEVTNALID